MEAWESLVGECNKLALLILTHEVLVTSLRGSLKTESLDVEIIVVVGIIEYSRPHFGLIKLLYTHEACTLVVIIGIKVGGVEITIIQDHKHHVIAVKFSKIVASLIEIETLHIVIKPHLATS